MVFFLRFLAGAVMSAQHIDHGRLVRTCVIALIWELAVLSIYLFNGVMDVQEDRINGSRRPIASGSLSAAVAAWVAAGAGIVALGGGIAMGEEIAWAVVMLLAFGYFYSGPPAYLKRRPLASAVTGMSLGLLSYFAGLTAYGEASWLHPGPALPVFAIATALWMGLVGGTAKDLSDVAGDVAAGRSTIPAICGEVAARRLVAGVALGLAVTFCTVGTMLVPLLFWPGVGMLIGATAMAVVCLGGFSQGSRLHRRRPYRVFMVTQYLIHLSVIVALPMRFLLSA